ncbi:MAG: alanine--glyoxylate aminotransferase family protein [Halanaeroarchaeum sp.]
MSDPDRLLMTPGPTELPPEVREAMGRRIHNPDVEPEFAEFYRTLTDKLRRVYGTDDDLVVLGGEGILGLEAAVASLVDEGEEVLCLANGPYGEGFADFVEMHGGEPTVHPVPPGEPFDPEEVAREVGSENYVAATMVHCETPLGQLTPLEPVLEVLQDAGVLTVVDAVSSLGGTPVPVESIDVALGASQKAFSAPPGLTTVSASDAAWEKIEETDQDTFYTSLEPWHDVEPIEASPTALPYTHLVSNLYALDAAVDLLLDEGIDRVFERHETARARTLELGAELGLEPFPGRELASPTVTAFEVPGRATAIQERLRSDHDVVMATGLGDHEEDVIRVGHMGYNATVERVERAMDALGRVLRPSAG